LDARQNLVPDNFKWFKAPFVLADEVNGCVLEFLSALSFFLGFAVGRGDAKGNDPRGGFHQIMDAFATFFG